MKPGGEGALRRAEPRDLDRLAALWASLAEHHASLDPLFALRPDAERHIRDMLAAELRERDAAIFVWDREADLLGFCAVRSGRAAPILEEVERAEITDLAVRPDARRNGIGRALVAAAFAWVRARGLALSPAAPLLRQAFAQGASAPFLFIDAPEPRSNPARSWRRSRDRES